MPTGRARRRPGGGRKAAKGTTASVSATRRRQQAFLAAFAANGCVRHAARAAGVSRSVVYHWRGTDEGFERQFQDAAEEAADVVEYEARRRAVDGWEEEVYQGGKLVGTVKKYSDPLLMMLLRCRRPEIYGNRVEVRAQAVGATQPIDPTTCTNQELAERIAQAQEALIKMGCSLEAEHDCCLAGDRA